MKLAINQAYFFPYIGFFQLINSVDKCILYEHVNFRKRTWMTRNQILMKGTGKPFFIRIPVENKSSFRKIRDIKIKPNLVQWKSKFLSVLKFNYAKAPYYKEIFPLIEDLMNTVPMDYLHEFNAIIIQRLCQYLDINTVIQYSNEDLLEIEYMLEEEYEHSTVLTTINKKTQRILSICQKENATQYVNLPGARAMGLYDKEVFASHQLQLQFIKPLPYKYMQSKHPFVPHLSIIDVLMHNGYQGTTELIKNYQLN